MAERRLEVQRAIAAPPEVGEAAPDFLLEGTDGALYRLSEHVGQRGVVLAWFALRGGSLSVPLLLHAGGNLLAVVALAAL